MRGFPPTGEQGGTPTTGSQAVATAQAAERRTAGAARAVQPLDSQLERAYRALREMILAGELAPGSRIMAADLAKRLEFDRRTVQVVLHRLDREGLLERLDGSYARWRIAPLTAEGFREVVEVIAVIEGWAGRAVAELPPDRRAPLVAELRTINAKFQAAGDKERLDGLGAGNFDDQFHELTLALAGPQLRSVLAVYRPRFERYLRHYMYYLVSDLAVSATEHEAIIDAIDDGDADATERAIRANRFGATQRYAEVIGRMGDRGHW